MSYKLELYSTGFLDKYPLSVIYICYLYRIAPRTWLKDTEREREDTPSQLR
jgi:hypothetical protein